MGDQTDGSSSAALSAQDDDSDTEQRGLWQRFVSTISGSDTGDDGAEGDREKENADPHATDSMGILNLRRMRVEDVAIPKVEIVAVPNTIKKEELVDVFRESGFTRLPVYKGTLDTPMGFVHLKDLALRHGFSANGTKFSLKAMLRPLLYAPPSMGTGVLLQKMQSERIHMALVIDEYGGVDGLVTIEDLIETVIGEIEDEHDLTEGPLWRRDKQGGYVVDARAPLDEFEAEIGVKLGSPEADEDVDTLGGLVFMMTGRVPVRGEMVPHPTGAEFEVVDADPRRLKRLRVRLPGALEDGAA
ncbi:magnesium/cobalt efflux protein [Brevirhabdus pacifica]|uniref:Magnesium/cobalt efflux protein n=1 Tax=Brevirhabdus pacifica TaxID=1267768 RepID=A0A1U7DKF2_9RHOB|nr:hemolysin family protein [Brevirhabdus pacifica]APX90452.1 magnesium/cobalt efflux protein [Brevirhabdus pacifica]OWU78530.1 conjugal transfer protein [Loktanella sp. 22II-4b]PJJ85448.1 magnesium and cobalt transporter [Brevirhabdus pacifica]